MPVLTESARAKVNLTLRVEGRRADGYHDIESLVAFADCADTLTLELGPSLGLTTKGPMADACGESADNLVLRAATLLSETVPNLIVGHFTLDKNLPVAAGIGGGSADAAAALRLLARANGLKSDDARLIDAARQTGADIPVCLPSHACIMTGVGEQLSMIDLPRLACVMVNPRVAVATKDVFAALGLRHGEILVGPVDVLQSTDWPGAAAAFENWMTALSTGTNDLERPALKVEPVICDVLAALRGTKGIFLARMSGSGATCFGIYANGEDAAAAAKSIAKTRSDWWVHAGALS